MALGGRVAEILTFNRSSTGAEKDLKKVTDLAYAMVIILSLHCGFYKNILGCQPSDCRF